MNGCRELAQYIGGGQFKNGRSMTSELKIYEENEKTVMGHINIDVEYRKEEHIDDTGELLNFYDLGEKVVFEYEYLHTMVGDFSNMGIYFYSGNNTIGTYKIIEPHFELNCFSSEEDKPYLIYIVDEQNMIRPIWVNQYYYCIGGFDLPTVWSDAVLPS